MSVRNPNDIFYQTPDGSPLSRTNDGYMIHTAQGWVPYTDTPYSTDSFGTLVPVGMDGTPATASPKAPVIPAPDPAQSLISNWQYRPANQYSGTPAAPVGNVYGRTPLAPFVPQAQSNGRPTASGLLGGMSQSAPRGGFWANYAASHGGGNGGAPATMAAGGPVMGQGGGQADNVLTTARPKSFIIPADVVAHLGDGSSREGHRRLSQTWASMGYAVGGSVRGGGNEVPVALSPDEHAVPPEVVTAIGRGSNQAGTAKLHQMMNHVRAHKAKKGHPPVSKSPLAYMGMKNAPPPQKPSMIQQSPLMQQ